MARGPQRVRAPRIQGVASAPIPGIPQALRPATRYDPQGRLITARDPRSNAPQVTYDAARGGEWHTYPDGRNVFVKKSPAPAAPAAPTPAAQPAAAQPDAGPTAPDSQFAYEANDLMRDVFNRRQALTLDAQRAAQDYATAGQRREVDRADTLRGTDLNANAQGLLYSGTLGKRRGDVETNFNQQVDDARLGFERANADRQAALDAIGDLRADSSSPLGYSGTGPAWEQFMRARMDAVDRNIERGRTTPVTPGSDDGGPADNLIAGPAPAAAKKKPLKSYVKDGWFYRESSDGSGRMLRIRRASK